MSDQPQNPQTPGEDRPMTEEELQNLPEEELRALYEQQLDQQMSELRVEDVVIQSMVTMINLAGRRAGLAPGTEGERDPAQLGLAIEGAKALLPLVEPMIGADAEQIKTAISQLQMAYVQMTGQQGGGEAGTAPGAGDGDAGGSAPAGEGAQGGGPGPAQSSGRLWVPGQ